MTLTPADMLTSLRILLIAPLTWTLYLERWDWTLVLYLTIPVTDILDGHLARRGRQPTLGPRYDALADVAFGVALLLWGIWKLPAQRSTIIGYTIVIAILFICYALVSIRKAGQALLLHLWTGKLTGWSGYLWFLFSIYFGWGVWTMHVAGTVTSIYYLECIVYVLRGKTAQDGRSAFF